MGCLSDIPEQSAKMDSSPPRRRHHLLPAPFPPLLNLLIAFTFVLGFSASCALCYVRPPARGMAAVSAAATPTTPEQVHISLVGTDKMRVSWITKIRTPSTVDYGTSPGVYTGSSIGSSSTYNFLIFYTSGYIHNVDIGPLLPGTAYFYRCSNASIEFSFKTPPAQLPIMFVVLGDPGQTDWTKSTLNHVAASNYDVLLLPGDLSYADNVQTLWDSFGRLVQPLASQRPWMVTEGNHEIEILTPLDQFRAYNARWRMPYELSGSTSNLYYSFDAAGGAVHVIMLGSYTGYLPGSAQYRWLVSDLAKINRQATPWVVALMHAPWYNSNTAHQLEAEPMRWVIEDLLYKARVDVVLTGHVHAYERFDRVYQYKKNACAPVYIVVGDGGNKEGLASSYLSQPAISLFREASFGHGQLNVVNRTHATWSWHRNQDDVAVKADSVWLTSLAATAGCL